MADMGLKEAVAEELSRAADIGETRTRAQLQASIAIGAGDLGTVLNEMREAGEASEVAPGEWEPVTGVAVPAEPAPDEPMAPVEPGADDPVPGTAVAETRHGSPAPGERETVLSRAMVESLDPDALGKLVLAGVQGEDGPFVLRVEP